MAKDERAPPSYKCPFCKSRPKAFLPFGPTFPVFEEKEVVGGGYRLCLCPVCKSNDRERLVYLYLLRKTNIFEKPQSVLHIAPEKRLKQVLSREANLDYVTADLHKTNVMIKMDITKIQFPNDHFDAIICNHVLEHVTDDRRAMSELFRVLKPLGWAILQVPISMVLEKTYEDFSILAPQDRAVTFGQADHVRIYAKNYPARLALAGFKVRVFDWTTEIHKFGGDRNIFGLNKCEAIYLGFK